MKEFWDQIYQETRALGHTIVIGVFCSGVWTWSDVNQELVPASPGCGTSEER